MWPYLLELAGMAIAAVVLAFYDFGEHADNSAEARAAAAGVMNDIIDDTPGIQRLPDPPAKSDVRRAYIALSRKYHPDKCRAAEEKAKLTEISQALNRVWSVWSGGDLQGDESDAEPDGDATRRVYNITIAHTAEPGKRVPTSRQNAADAVLRAYKEAYPRVAVQQWAVFEERHGGSGVAWKREKHWHIAVKASRTHRWLPVKRALEADGFYVHFSDSHGGYHSAFRYGYVPTAKKPRCELDSTPLLSDGHPAPFDASMPNQKTYSSKDKAKGPSSRSNDAEAGAPPPKKIRLTKTVMAHNAVVSLGMKTGQQLTAYAIAENNDGRPKLLEFVHGVDAQGFVEKVWKAEGAGGDLQRLGMTRLQILERAAEDDCVCGGEWRGAVERQLIANDIDPAALSRAIWAALDQGAKRGHTVVIIGPPGCGKTTVLKPLRVIYNAHPKPPQHCSYPFLHLERREICFWNDFRYRPDTIAWEDLLNLFEGEEITIARPQNSKNYEGHLKYIPTQPVFISCDAFFQNGDPTEDDMMRDRCEVFRLTKKLPRGARLDIPPCPRCFARWILAELYPTQPAAPKQLAPPPPAELRQAGGWTEYHTVAGQPYYARNGEAAVWSPPEEFRAEFFSQ